MRRLVIAGFFAALVMPNALFVVAYGRNYLPGVLDALNPFVFPARGDRDLLANSRWGWYRVIDFTRRFLPPEASVLVFRQNDFVFYGAHRVIRDVDPRMIPVYTQPGREEAYRALIALGVDYFYLPSYDTPTQYNTPVGAVLADPELARLVFEQRGTRLYRLVPPAERRRLGTRPMLDAKAEWLLYSDGPDWRPVTLPHEAEAGDREALWLQSGEGSWQLPPPELDGDRRFRPGATLRVKASVTGHGWVRLYAIEYSGQGRGIAELRPLRESALKDREPFQVDVQFRTHPRSSGMRFLMIVKGAGRFRIGAFDVTQVEELLPYGLAALGAAAPRAQGLAAGSVLDSQGHDGDYFSGPGHYLVPPSAYGAEPPRPAAWGMPSAYRVVLEARGEGRALLSAVTFDHDGMPQATPLETLTFTRGNAVIERVLVLGPEVREYRVGLLPVTESESLLDWTKRFFWSDLPPRHVPAATAIRIDRLEVTPLPEAIGDLRVRDCLLARRSRNADTAAVCRR
ncbi:MAG: hypothetical protein IT529_03090 [Burkholderiales bacterium]|nr:hypothetical protein [Burkholderiales bacterium]